MMFNSVDDVQETFQKTYPGSGIATRMKLGHTKATYIDNFGILPYVFMLLHDSINKPSVYILSFDESLNKVRWKCKMDLIICSRDDDNMVKVTNKLAPERLYQICMDGPKVNLRFYRELEAKHTESFYQSLIDIGTCSFILCMLLLNLVLKAHPGASKTS